MESKTLDRLSKAFACFCSVYLIVYLFLYIKGNLFYFGEAISYEGLIRTLYGMPFASAPEEIPLSLTPYTPFFLMPLMLVGKLFSIIKIETLSVIARLFQIGLLVCLFGLLNRMRKRFFPDLSSGWAFFWVVLPVFFYSPPMELGLRPDTLSFLCEAASVFSMLAFLPALKKKYLLLAAFFSGLAIAIKLNTIGAAVGMMVFCYFLLDIEKYSIYALFTVGLAAILEALQYQILGEALPDNIWKAIQSALLSPKDAIQVYLKFFDLFLFPFTYYLFLIFYGLSHFAQKKEKVLFILILGFSFLFAFAGQIKWGAFHNYFLGFIYLGLIPASIGLHQLITSNTGPKRTAVVLFHFFFITLFIIRGSSIPLKIWQDRAYLNELNQLRALVDEKAPRGYLYTNDEQLQIAFAHRTAIGVLSQELLQVTPKLQKHIPKIQEKLKTLPAFSAYIFKCEDFDSGNIGGIFLNLEDVKKRTRTTVGKYCLFF